VVMEHSRKRISRLCTEKRSLAGQNCGTYNSVAGRLAGIIQKNSGDLKCESSIVIRDLGHMVIVDGFSRF